MRFPGVPKGSLRRLWLWTWALDVGLCARGGLRRLDLVLLASTPPPPAIPLSGAKQHLEGVSWVYPVSESTRPPEADIAGAVKTKAGRRPYTPCEIARRAFVPSKAWERSSRECAPGFL